MNQEDEPKTSKAKSKEGQVLIYEEETPAEGEAQQPDVEEAEQPQNPLTRSQIDGIVEQESINRDSRRGSTSGQRKVEQRVQSSFEVAGQRDDMPQDEDMHNLSRYSGGAKGSETTITDLTEVEKLRTRIFRLQFATLIGGMISATVIMFCLVVAYKSFDKRYFQFETILDSWKKPVIWDIKVSLPNGSCPTNYTQSLSYYWPGVNAGCDCRGAVAKYEKKIYTYHCKDDMVSKGCIDSPNVEGKEFKQWKENGTLCENRLPSVTMDKMVNLSLPDTKECSPGYMICPPPAPDTDFAWRMCVPASLGKCPITALRIANCTHNPDPNCYSKTTESKVNLGNEECVWLSRICGRGPISMLAMGEHGICRQKGKIQITPGHTESPLLKIKRKGCRTNDNAVLIDTLPQDAVFEMERIPYKMIRGFEEEITTYTFGLYQVYYSRWTWEHRTSTDLTLVFNNRLMIQKLEDLHKTSIMYFTFSVFVFVFVSPALLYFETENPTLYEDFKGLRQAKIAVRWFFRLSAVPVILLMTTYNAYIWRRFRAYSDDNFSNEFENQHINEISMSLESGIYIFDRVALWMAVLAIVYELILDLIIWRITKKLKIILVTDHIVVHST